MDAAEVPTPDQGTTDGVVAGLGVIIQMALAGLLGAGVLLTYFTIAFWTSGWIENPRFEGLHWYSWMLLAVFGAGLVSLVAGVVLSLGWLMRAGRRIEAGFWSVASMCPPRPEFHGDRCEHSRRS